MIIDETVIRYIITAGLYVLSDRSVLRAVADRRRKRMYASRKTNTRQMTRIQSRMYLCILQKLAAENALNHHVLNLCCINGCNSFPLIFAHCFTFSL